MPRDGDHYREARVSALLLSCMSCSCHVIVMMESYIIFYFSNLLCRLRSASFCNLQSFRLKILQSQELFDTCVMISDTSGG